MFILKNILFCIPLRIGNIFIGLIGAICYLVAFFHFIIQSSTYPRRFPNKIYFITIICVALLQTIVCVTFVVGVLKKKRHFILPWLIDLILNTILLSVYIITRRSFHVVPFGITFILLQAYLWFCGYSLYQRLTEEQSGHNMASSTKSGTFSETISKYQNLDLIPELPVSEKVLFCIPLRLANFIIGLMETIFYLAISICLIYQSTKEARHFSHKLYFITIICVSLFQTTVCAIFVVGIFKRIQNLILPKLLSQILVTVVVVALYFMQKRHRSLGYVSLVIHWIMIQGYIWHCGYSVYQRTPTRGTEYNSIPSSEQNNKFNKLLITNDDQDLNIQSKLPIFDNVLVCIPLRLGNILLGSIGTIFYLVISISLFIKSIHDAHQFFDKIYFVTLITLLLGHTITCAIFVVGVLKKKQRILLPWLVSQILLTAALVIIYLSMSIYRGVISVAINWIILQTYIWLCGYSIYERTPSRGADYNSISQDLNVQPKLTVLENVMWFLPLRAGNIKIGLMTAIFYLIISVCLIIKSTMSAYHFSEKCQFISLISVTLAHSILCLIFVFGILKMKQRLLLPWLFSQIFMTIVSTILHISAQPTFNVALMVINWIILQSYIWHCGYSIYQTICTQRAECNTEENTEQNVIPTNLSGTFSELLTLIKYQYTGLLSKFPVLESVLLCFPLRIGNILMGSLGTIFYLVLSICLIIKSLKQSHHFSDKVWFVSAISVTFVHSIMCVIFVIGILKKRHHHLLPWLFTQILLTVVMIVVVASKLNHSHEIIISIAVNWIVFQAYLWVCGYSIYQLMSTEDTVYNNLPPIVTETFSEMLSSNKYQNIDY